MGITQRKYQYRLDLLSNSLKRPLHLVADTMTFGFSDEQFYERFKELFPNAWKQICDTYEDLKRLNDNREKRHLRKVPALAAPQDYLEKRSKAIIVNRRKALTKESPIEEAEKLYQTLRAKAVQVRAKAARKEKEMFAVQQLKPEEFEMLQKMYFELRKKSPQDIDERLNILLEIAKYKSKETVTFLKKIQNCERNSNLQQYAYQALIEMQAPNVWLQRGHKGKKKLTDTMKPNKISTPKALLQHIQQSKWQRHMSKDFFISHRSTDKEIIKSLKEVLNKQGFDCYVDWMYDREQLMREYSCKETAEVLIERLKQSKALLYVLTEESLKSIWMPWELGFFNALNKPIYVYMVIKDEDIPEYIELYAQVWIKDNQLGYEEDNMFIPLTRKNLEN